MCSLLSNSASLQLFEAVDFNLILLTSAVIYKTAMCLLFEFFAQTKAHNPPLMVQDPPV